MNNLPKILFSFPLICGDELRIQNIPLWVTSSFLFNNGMIGKHDCIYVFPKANPRIVEISKMVEELARYDARSCIVCSPKLSYRQKLKLVELNIAFIASESNVYIPFIGLAISKQSEKVESPNILSPQAQLLVINILLSKYVSVDSTHLAKQMNKSLPSISNYLDEIQAICPKIVSKKGRVRTLSATNASKEELHKTFGPYMSTPVKREFFVACKVNMLLKYGASRAGYLALDEYSDLAESGIPTVAMSSAQVRTLFNEVKLETAQEEDATARIQVWRYWSNEWASKKVDPISLYYAMNSEINDDARTSKALKALLEGVLREGTTTF